MRQSFIVKVMLIAVVITVSAVFEAQAIPMPANADIGHLYAGMPSQKGKVMLPKPGFKRLSEFQRKEKVLEEAKQYEVILVSKMLEEAVPKGGDSMLFGGGHGNDIYRSMMIEEYAKSMVDGGGLGLAEQIAKEIMLANRR
jgi:hypothetical protein